MSKTTELEITPELAAQTEDAPTPDMGLTDSVAMAGQLDQFVKTNAATLNQVGAIQAFNYMNQFTELARLKLLADLKESKEYKGCSAVINGEVKELKTFEDLCQASGVSYRKVAEDLQNLAFFGEEFMEASKRLGLGYRDFRKLRALPEDDRKLILEGEAVSEKDPEALKDLIEELAARNAKAREEKAELENTAKAKDQVLTKKNKTIDELQTKLAKLESVDPDERLKAQGQREKNARVDLATRGGGIISEVMDFLALAGATLDDQDISPATHEYIQENVSSLAATLADAFAVNSPFEIDFQALVYPDFLREQAAGKDNDEAADAETDQEPATDTEQ